MKPASNDQPFEWLSIVIIQSPELGEERINEIRAKLEANGARSEDIRVTDGSEQMEVRQRMLFISDTVNFTQYSYLDCEMATIVKSSFVDAVCDEYKKMIPTQPFSPDPKYIFKDTFVCCSGLSAGDRANLYGGIKAMGGDYSDSLTTFTTHVIALNDQEEKCKTALKNGKKVVLPHWVDHCLKLGRKLDEAPYLLPNAPIFTELEKYNKDSIDLDSFVFSHFHHNVEPNHQNKGVLFANKLFYLCEDLKEGLDKIHLLPIVIENQGGEITEDVEQANVYIGRFRAGEAYKRACLRQIDVGSTAWVYWMAQRDTWQPPKMLLHYPIPDTPVPGFEEYRIAITNFTGEARAYLESLIEACGATYTRTLRQDNTHLIAAMPHGNKYETARKWGKHVVNAMWLEESYSMHAKQPESSLRYTQLPDRLDLTEVLNQTVLKPKVLYRFYNDGKTPQSSAKRSSAMMMTNGEEGTPTRSPSVRGAKSKAEESLKEQGAAEWEWNQKWNKSKHTKRHELPAIEGESQVVEQPEPVQQLKRAKTYHRSKRASSTIASTIGKENEENQAVPTMYYIATGISDSYLAMFAKKKGVLQQLGIQQAAEVGMATHLMASDVKRTPKFLSAMARVEAIILPEYVKECINQGKRLPLEDAHYLSNKHPKLGESLKKRDPIKRLFDGVVFNFTDDPECNPFHDIVRDHGAEFQVVPKRKAGNKAAYRSCGVGTLLIAPGSNAKVDQFKKCLPSGIALKKDFLVDAIMSMELDLDSNQFAL